MLIQTGRAAVPSRMVLPADEPSSIQTEHVFAIWLYAFDFELSLESSDDKIFITSTKHVVVIGLYVRDAKLQFYIVDIHYT